MICQLNWDIIHNTNISLMERLKAREDLKLRELIMYKHCDDDRFISLHDCHATEVLYENGILTFVFDDGIWIAKGHPSNVVDKIVRTDVAEVKFCLETGDEYDISLYVFERKLKNVVRKEWELSKLIKCVNDEKYTLEFLYQYKGFNSMIIECWLWSDKKPYHRECELKLSLTDVKYYWNNLCEDIESNV